jgi:hypothetical protein
MEPPGRCSRELGMKWRVMLELIGPDGIVGVHEVGGRAAVAQLAAIGAIRSQLTRLFWLRRPSARLLCQVIEYEGGVARAFVGTA